MPPSQLRLRTTIEASGPAAHIVLTDEQVAALADVKNPPVTVTIDGATARLRVARMGGLNLIGLSKAARAQLGVEYGQEVDVVIAHDAAERTVELPAELVEALAGDPAAREAFDRLPYSARKEAARGIAEAKKAETRERRLVKLLDQLR